MDESKNTPTLEPQASPSPEAAPVFEKPVLEAQGMIVREEPEKTNDTPRWKRPFENWQRTLLFAGQAACIAPIVYAGMQQGDPSRVAIPLAALSIGSTGLFAKPDVKGNKPEGETTLQNIRESINSPDSRNAYFKTAVGLPLSMMAIASNTVMGIINTPERLVSAAVVAYGMKNAIGYFSPSKPEKTEAEPENITMFSKAKLTAVGLASQVDQKIENAYGVVSKPYKYVKSLHPEIKALSIGLSLSMPPMISEATRRISTGDNSGMTMLFGAVMAIGVSIGSCAYTMSRMSLQKTNEASR